jgi:hypothetical protein
MARVVSEAPAGETIVGIVTESGDGRRTFRKLVWSLSGLAVLAVVIVMLRPVLWPPTLSMRAVKLMALPPNSNVLAVNEGRWDREGVVEFSLPEPKGPGSRLTEVWLLNGFPAPVAAASVTGFGGVSVAAPTPTYPGMARITKYRITGSEAYSTQGPKLALSYDPAKKVYRFERSGTH